MLARYDCGHWSISALCFLTLTIQRASLREGRGKGEMGVLNSRGLGLGLGGLWHTDAKHPILRIVPWPLTFSLSSKASGSSRVIPANNPLHSCKYSTGMSQYNTMGDAIAIASLRKASPSTIFGWFVVQTLYCNKGSVQKPQ